MASRLDVDELVVGDRIRHHLSADSFFFTIVEVKAKSFGVQLVLSDPSGNRSTKWLDETWGWIKLSAVPPTTE